MASPERVPPHDRDAESAVLAAVFIEPSAIAVAADLVTQEDFYDTRLSRIYAAMLSVWRRGDAPDTHTVRDVLSRNGNLENIGGEHFLVELAYAATTSAHVAAHCAIVARKAQERRLIHAGYRIQAAAYEGRDDLMAIAQSALTEATGTEQVPVRAATDVYAEILPSIQDPTASPRLRYSLPDLEEHIVLAPGRLIYLAGRTNHGKSALASKVTWEAARLGARTLFVTMEMTAREIMLRLMAAEAGVRYTLLATGEADQYEADAVRNIQVPDSFHLLMRPGIDAVRLRAVAHSFRAKHGLDLLVVDYIQQMQHPQSERRDLAIGETSAALKRLAMDFQIPVLVCAQLNRASERREDGRPAVADLRESGSLEQDADCVALVWRPWLQSQKFEDADRLTVIVGKNRHDPPGTVDLLFRAQTMHIGCKAPVYVRSDFDEDNPFG